MAVVDHYIGVEEYSIVSEECISYHKYIPHDYIEYGEEAIHPPACDTLKKYYQFFDNLEVGKGFKSGSLFKTNSCGLWVSLNSQKEIEAYHSYFAYDYRGMTNECVSSFYESFGKFEPDTLKNLRQQELDIGIEGISIGLDGDVLKYITLFRPNSDVLSYLSDLEDIDKVQEFIDLNYTNIKQGLAADPDSFKSPIRIQFDSSEDGKISIELVSAFFQKEYYLSNNSYDGYLNRKDKYFDRMMQTGLLSEKEAEFCKEKSPSWQQFSVKFKWEDGIIVDKKLYTFVVVDFEEVE